MTYSEYTEFKKQQPIRLSLLTEYAIRNYDTFYRWAEDHGMITQPELNEMRKRIERGEYEKWQKFLGTEVISRTFGIKALQRHYGYRSRDIQHMPLLWHYDMVAPDGTREECKFRTNETGVYPTDDIDIVKQEYVMSADTGYTELLYTHWDGVVNVYDLDKPDNTGTWTKRYKTMDEDTDIVETTKLMYNPSSAIWTASTITPDWTQTI